MGNDKKEQKRKNLGAFFTPSNLAELTANDAIDIFLRNSINSFNQLNYSTLDDLFTEDDISNIQLLDQIIKSLRILDGSSGDGEFLISVFKRIKEIRLKINDNLELKKEPNSMEIEILNSNIFGMEIDVESLLKCHKRLLKNIDKSYLPHAKKIIDLNIIKGDFLLSRLDSWKNVPHQDSGFDIILGNPPWGAKLTKNQKNYYYDLFALKCPKRNLNTFSLFVYQATQLIKPNQGILAYLLPKNISRSNQYTFLREHLLTNYKILKYNFYGLFRDVTQEFSSLIAERTENVPNEHIMLIDDKNRVPQSIYLSNIDFIFTRTYNIHTKKLINLITRDSIPLGKFITIKRGEELSKRGTVMYCPYCSIWVQLSSRKAEIICPQCLKILYQNNIQVLNLIQKKRDSKYCQPILTGEDFDKYEIKSQHYINPRVEFRSKKNKEIYKSPKLVIQKIKSYPCLAFDVMERWTTQNVYNLALNSEYADNEEILYYILAVLNSSLYQWYYEYQFNLGSKYTNAISIHNLKRLLIKRPNFSDQNYNQIIEKSKAITTSPDESKALLINKIDELVLGFYGCEDIFSFIIETF